MVLLRVLACVLVAGLAAWGCSVCDEPFTRVALCAGAVAVVVVQLDEHARAGVRRTESP
jgi:hypothetical protein